MKPDIEKYRHFVDRFDLTEKQKAELIQTIWRIMESFADRAFGLDTAHLARTSGLARRGDCKLVLKTHFHGLSRRTLQRAEKTIKED